MRWGFGGRSLDAALNHLRMPDPAVISVWRFSTLTKQSLRFLKRRIRASSTFQSITQGSIFSWRGLIVPVPLSEIYGGFMRFPLWLWYNALETAFAPSLRHWILKYVKTIIRLVIIGVLGSVGAMFSGCGKRTL
jgi:hypothetical protein